MRKLVTVQNERYNTNYEKTTFVKLHNIIQKRNQRKDNIPCLYLTQLSTKYNCIYKDIKYEKQNKAL